MWCALPGSKHHAVIEPDWHSNGAQWAEKEFYCKPSPWGIGGILQESSYSWSLIIAKLPICKIRLHLNTTFKYETRTRRRRSPLRHPGRVCREGTREREFGGEGRTNKNTSRGTPLTQRNEKANHRTGLIINSSSTITFKWAKKELNKITSLRH